MPRRLIALLIPLLALGCVLKGTHNETVARNIELSSQLSGMQKERDTLKSQLDELQKKASQLEARNEELSNTNQMLVGKNSEYSKRSLDSQQQLVAFKQQKVKAEEKTDFPVKIYEELQKTFKAEIADGSVRVLRDGENLSVTFSDGPLFLPGTVKLLLKGQKLLKRAVPALKDAGERHIEVQGHTDNQPVPGPLKKHFATTWELSTAQAAKVLRFLGDQGIDPTKLAAVGYGEYHPITSNDSVEGQKKNRRIEIVVMPVAAPPTKK